MGATGGRGTSDVAGSGVDVPPWCADARLNQDQALVVEGFAIGGWSPPRHRHGWGLLVGEMDERCVLSYAAKVEFGITPDVRAVFGGAARASRPSDFAVRPTRQRACGPS
jgi:hypothetical protein